MTVVLVGVCGGAVARPTTLNDSDKKKPNPHPASECLGDVVRTASDGSYPPLFASARRMTGF